MSSRLVYSSSGDNQCPRCNKALHKCKCPAAPDAEPDAAGGVRIQRQSKGRAGKQVTVISGLRLGKQEKNMLLKNLKSACGSGGTLKGTTLEIQGDCRERVLQVLKESGIDAKISGG